MFLLQYKNTNIYNDINIGVFTVSVKYSIYTLKNHV